MTKRYLSLLLLLVGCGGTTPIVEGPPADAGRTAFDSGVPTADAGPADAGATDAGAQTLDAGMRDAGLPDAGRPDAGTTDAGTNDGGRTITSRRDAGALLEDGGFWSWARVQPVLQRTPSDAGVSVRWIDVPGPTPVERAWAGGVLLLDGGVVGIPFNESAALAIDVDSHAAVRWPIAGGAVPEGWHGGVLLPDGTVIGIPRRANRFLRIDPAAGTATPFGDDLSDLPADGGLGRFRGGVLAHNGLVYAAPANANVIARFDPRTGQVARLPLPPDRPEGRTHGAVLFPNGDIVMFPVGDYAGLLVVPSADGASDEVWILPRPAALPVGVTAFSGGGILTGAQTAVGAPQQNLYPLLYDQGLFAWGPAATSLDLDSSNAYFYGAWSTNGHFYLPPFGGPFVLELDATGASRPIDAGTPWFRGTVGAVGLPDGRVIGIPHARGAWLELRPDDAVTVPLETMTSPFLDKL